MREEPEWVPVEVTWDEDRADQSDELEWDERPWELDSLFDRRPRPVYPALPQLQTHPPRALNPGGKRRDERARPKRQKADAQLSKRKRKKLRAWEVEDDE